MDPRVANEVSITDLFDQFIEASTMRNVLSTFHRILNYADLNPCEYNVFFPKLKRAVMTSRVRKNWKAKALFSKIDKKAAHRCYSNTKVPTPLGTRPSKADSSNQSLNSQDQFDDNSSSPSTRQYYNNNALRHHNCLIIGSGPAGLRTAIELQLLGASKVVVVEKRSRFSRNNVLHLWPFVIDDLKSLGAKKFYGKFCAGSIDHISIRQLQLILLKICLMIGCEFRDSCSYLNLCPASIAMDSRGVNNVIESDNEKAYGSRDSIKSTTLRCDFDTDENLQNEFIKVSESLLDSTCDKHENGDGSNAATQISEDRISCDKLSNNDSTISEAAPNHPDISTDDLDKSLKTKDATRAENLRGCRAHFETDYKLQEKELHSYEWDIIIGADGRRNALSKFFPRKEFRGRLAIAITANFINRQTPLEACVPEISGLSFIYNQDMFNALAYDTDIQLENICYYKDDTHYFVMTAKKKSLLERGVLIEDFAATQDLLADSNVNRQALLKYAKDAALWTTGLEPLDFALNHYGQEDCAMFDFTSMYAATNACKALRTKHGGLTLLGLVGDSLLEPFWPTGSGCARGFLSSFDASWMCRQWAVNRCAIIDHHNVLSRSKMSNQSPNPNHSGVKVPKPTTYDRMALSVMAERESIYRILAQTTSENLQQNYSLWTLNPHSRYPNLNRHLVTPVQIEHLLFDKECKSQLAVASSKNKPTPSNSERPRRIKSPHSSSSARKSPKKLKSANSSPLAQHRNLRNSSRMKQGFKSRSRHEINLDDTYLEFEKSYNNLADSRNRPNHYLSHKRPDCDIYDDYFDSALSGTLPSSNNLLSLEAKRARDIDDCLRQRRQKTQLNVVRDQLINQFRGQSANREEDINEDKGGRIVPNGGSKLFNEIRRRREVLTRGKENAPDVSSLTLLNSIRRCASFAERVKSFENKLSSASSRDESALATPRSPESVKNLPHFATLQELFVGNSTLKPDKSAKSRIPVMKLTKDDWNVKCWEKRLAAYHKKTSNNHIGSSKSLNTPILNEIERKPEKQVAVFKDRIKEMAEKLENAKNTNHKLYGHMDQSDAAEKSGATTDRLRSLRKGWVNHLKHELTKGSENRKTQQMVNPIAPNRTIKKLFADDNDEDDGIDVNKHYDHLCINRPINKYLSKNSGYSSHLVRTKYDSSTSRVINRTTPITASKQAYLTAIASRGSSASSTLSNYSTTTGESNSTNASSNEQSVNETCFRCNKLINSSVDKISISDFSLHLNCLTCASCSLTLRTSEVQYYLDTLKESTNAKDFHCSICKPSIKDTDEGGKNILESSSGQSALRSREDFLNERINYNELYKNILDRDSQKELIKVDHLDIRKSSSDFVNGELRAQISRNINAKEPANPLSPSPVQITLPLNLVTGRRSDSNHQKNGSYTIARSQTVDGSEQVTLVLPESDEKNNTDRTEYVTSKTIKAMVDEEELERFHHLDKLAASTSNQDDESPDNHSSSDSNKEDESNDTSDDNRSATQLPDDASSLDSSFDVVEYDDANTDENSTDGDFITSEEFGPLSDCEEQDNNGELMSQEESDGSPLAESNRNISCASKE